MDIREKRIKSERIYTGRVIKLDVDTVVLPNGNEATRELVRHPGGAAVAALDDDDNIYLVRQYRAPYDDILLEIPAGKLDPGENPLCAAKRELSEETGLTCRSIEHIGNFYPSVGFLDEVLHLYIATGLSRGEKHPDEDEFLNLVKMPFSQAVDLVMDGTIKDGKTIAAILKTKIIFQK